MDRRTGGTILTTVGALIAAAGIIGAAVSAASSGDADGTELAVATTAPPQSTSEPATPSESTTTTTRTATTNVPDPGPAVRSFYDAFAAALRSGDSAFLLDRMDPEVIARYSEATCRTYASRLPRPDYQVEVVSIDGRTAFDYATDGRSTTIPDAVKVRIATTSGGSRTEADAHVRVSGSEVHWFTDCGEP